MPMQMPSFLVRFTMNKQLVEVSGDQKALSPQRAMPHSFRPQSPPVLLTARQQRKEPIS